MNQQLKTLILFFFLWIGCFGIKSYASDAIKIDGIYYYLHGNNAEVTKHGVVRGYHGNIIIPGTITYNGKTYNVTSIGGAAFMDCKGLTSVTIPNSVTNIDMSAFNGCSGLTSVTIPNSVTSISDYAFSYCYGLTSMKVESGNTKYDSRNNCNAIIETASNTLIAGCKNTVIPNSVMTIGKRAFSGCSGLTSVTIPNSVTSIGGAAFVGCEGLTSITIPNSVTTIGNYAFSGCTGLTSVTIPESVKSIGFNTFPANVRIIANNEPEPNPLPTYNYATMFWHGFQENTTQKEFHLNIGINSSSKIEDVTITVNGVSDRGIKTVNSSDYDLTVNRTLTLNEGANVIKVTVRNAAGTTQEEKTVVYRPQGGELPSIEWLDFAATANKKEYQMKLGIKSKSKVEEVNVTVNGALTRGIKTVSSDGYDLTVDRTLALSEGVNRIVVSVRNGDGIATSEKVITYRGTNPTPVFNDKRIALVIGNSHYSASEMNLINPENDATDIAGKLKKLGFEVILRLDATLEDMDQELSGFREKAKDYDVAMFYYAGHGIQSKGVNYIIPTNINNLAEDNLKYKCVDMERVLDVMEDSKCKLKIVILDACRNDPLSRKWHRSTATRGLSIMNAPTGTIISFSTAPGNTALDGKGRNSPYTAAFLHTLDVPNLDIFHFFQKVGAEVKDQTEQSQNPWWSSSFTGDFYFNKQQ